MIKLFQQFMASGVIDSGIREDGGQQCYQQIPYNFHLYFNSLMTCIHIYFIYRWGGNVQSRHIPKPPEYQIRQQKAQQSTFVEKLIGISSIISLILTFYFKLMTKKGLFIFNPCHITLIIMTVLLFSKSSPMMRKIHSYWTTWLFGAYLALMVPHLEGISNFQVYLYYYEHLLIVPIGPIILYKRYGFLKPTIINQIACFSSMVIYQLITLTSLSRLFKVNLNFALCHSPADPFFDSLGHYYFLLASIHLNFASYVFRWLTYLIVKIWDISFYGKNYQFISRK